MAAYGSSRLPTFARLRLGAALWAVACLFELCSIAPRASAQVQIFVQDCRFTNSGVANNGTLCTLADLGPANSTNITAGQSIDFVWNGTANLHSAASVSAGPAFNFDCAGAFCSGSFTTGSVGPYTSAGDYTYQCNAHGPPMSGTIHVLPAALSFFTVSVPASATAGSGFFINVTAFDAFGNQATNYGGTIHFSSTDGQAALPGNQTLPGGSGTFFVTLGTGGSQTITVHDTNTTLATNTSGSIFVSP